MTHRNTLKKNTGFALLITIITLTVVVSVTLAIVELSLKQLELSVSSTDSELAFQAANAGMECARYVRNHNATDFETGQTIVFDCMNDSQSVTPTNPAPISGNGQVYVYSADFDWGTAPQQRCSQVDMVTMTVDDIGSNLVYAIRNIIPNYSGVSKTCDLGGRCTAVSVTGYSSTCAAKNTTGTLKRELLLEF